MTNTSDGNTSERQVDLNATTRSPLLNASSFDGFEPEKDSTTSLSEVVHAKDLVHKKDFNDLPDYQKIRIKHGDKIPGMPCFNELTNQLVSFLGGHREFTKIKIVMMNQIMDGKILAGHLYDMPMICTAERCIMVHSCPLTEVGEQYPVGKPCPVERAQIARWVQGYMDEIQEMDVQPSHKALVRELVSIHVTQTRIAATLAKKPSPMIDVSIGFDKDGHEVMQERESPLMKEQIALNKSMERIMRNLYMTRDQHKKGDQGLDSERAIYEAVMKKATEIFDRFGIKGENLHKGELKEGDTKDVKVPDDSYFSRISDMKQDDKKKGHDQGPPDLGDLQEQEEIHDENNEEKGSRGDGTVKI
jgi:hypothetical protein